MEKNNTPRNRKNIADQRFGQLIAIKPDHVKTNTVYWLCECDCGGETVTDISHLTKGLTTSCGCQESKNQQLIKQRSERNLYGGTNVAKIRASKARSDSKSGVRGVYWREAEQRWEAYIKLRGKQISLGRYKQLADAVKARADAEEKYFTPIIEEYDEVAQPGRKE